MELPRKCCVSFLAGKKWYCFVGAANYCPVMENRLLPLELNVYKGQSPSAPCLITATHVHPA